MRVCHASAPLQKTRTMRRWAISPATGEDISVMCNTIATEVLVQNVEHANPLSKTAIVHIVCP